MPASTLHKSAQQEAPDAYISLYKSTNLYMRAHKDARATYCARGQDMHARHSILRACKDARAASLARVQEMPARPPRRAYKTRARRLFLCAPKDGRANSRACKDARATPCYSRRKD